MMDVDLTEVKEILCELQRDIERKIRKRNLTPIITPGSYEYSNQISRYLIHGATTSAEAAELERWLFSTPSPSSMAQENARNCVKCWREYLERKKSYYRDFEDFKFEEPCEDEILNDYLVRMVKVVNSKGVGARLEWRAFKSFLDFLRLLPKPSHAFIEQIIPKKMEIFYGKVVKRTFPEEYPISENLTAKILMDLANMALHGRSDSQHGAAECLGLCWLCLTASRIRLPRELETMVYPIKSSALLIGGEFPILQVPSLFGDRPTRISKRFARYFDALSRIPLENNRESIFQKPYGSLTRIFKNALKRVKPDPKLGNITLTTFLSAPHPYGDHIR